MSQSSRAKFYYSKPWQKVRTAIANRDMNICQVCGRSLHRMYVDHIIPLSVCDDSQRLDAENLWTLCGGCHNHKTRCEEKMTAKELKIQTKSDWMRRLQKKARP
ncbi:HNH endonuclease [Lentilactobacillus kosonis]|uniref:Putative HNH nuclease YajD n=1 Tax=Lentilactobacillus kosonis TaxID=2810561 RepID=A0A401FPP5_9LACO|nr:HNH endonuclease [Lentilactobacillus kosonis]GAY74334.1 phage-associated homing endonuclease [Lentilactobacillus kosonis]